MVKTLDSGFRLGSWEVRPRLGTLTGRAGTAHLEPKVMAVLVCLAEHPGEVVSREQFIERVWRGRIVTDEVLSRCISLLRSSLEDSSRDPRMIQTVPKIGYRLIVPVEPMHHPPASDTAGPAGEAATAHAAPGKAAAWYRRLVLAAAAVVVLFAAGVYLAMQRDAGPGPLPPAAQPTIVVLPFVNRSDDPGNEYFSDGLTEELILRLSQVPELHVVASTSAFAFKNHSGDVRGIARRLGVQFVLEGSVRKEGDRARIAVQLIEAARGFHVWSEAFDTSLSDIFRVQDEIANDVVAMLKPRLAGSASAPISTTPPTDVPQAYQLLLQGRYHLKRREEGPIRRSMALFEQAIDLDPGFGEAYRELARAYVLLPYYSYENIDEMSQQALATLERGIAAVPALRDQAQDVFAFLNFANWSWVEAEEGFRRALQHTPHDPDIHQWYSEHLASVGRIAESLFHALEAKRLDVLSPVVNDRLAVAYLWADADELAQRQFDLASELGLGPTANPDAYLVLLMRRGEHDRARQLLFDLQALFAQARDWIDPFFAALADPGALPAAVAALEQAARERGISPQYLLGAWLYLGQADAALEAAFELLHEPAAFNVEFLFSREAAALRAHPRFGELVAAMGLDRHWEVYGWPEMCARRGTAIACR